MMRRTSHVVVVLLPALVSLVGAATLCRGDETGPTPYPKNDKDWPGRGPIRKFGWMVDNRNAFWKERAKAQGSIVFCGDSLTGGWKNLAKSFPNLKVANRGIGGDTSRGLLFRFKEDALDLNPKAVVILIGTNDLTAMSKPADAAFNIEEMLKQVERKNPALPVILCTTPPSDHPKAPVKLDQRRALNDEIRKLAAAHKNVVLLDLHAALANDDGSPKLENFAADKLHMGPTGYAKWAELLQPILAKLDAKN